jgi:hypothetical protein
MATYMGAYAIVLSGCYLDDEDQGNSFWYTGEDGQGMKGQQVDLSNSYSYF